MRRFTYITSGSKKFWEIEEPFKVENAWAVEVRFGRIGTGGQEHTNLFNDQVEAFKHYHRKVAEKLGKGYKETGQISVKKNVVNYTPAYIPVKPTPCDHNVIARIGNKWKCEACKKLIEFGQNAAPVDDSPFEVEVKVRRFFNVGGER